MSHSDCFDHLDAEETLQVRVMNAQLRALAGEAPARAGWSARVPSPRRELPPRAKVPIGALPTTEELPPRGTWRDLLDEALRQLRLLQSGLWDVTQATGHLAALPWEVVRLAARHSRFAHG